MSTFEVKPSTHVSVFVINGSQSPEDALHSYSGEGLSQTINNFEKRKFINSNS
jgi:hypothetical protein